MKKFNQLEEEKGIEISLFSKEAYLKLFETNRKMILNVMERVRKDKGITKLFG